MLAQGAPADSIVMGESFRKATNSRYECVPYAHTPAARLPAGELVGGDGEASPRLEPEAADESVSAEAAAAALAAAAAVEAEQASLMVAKLSSTASFIEDDDATGTPAPSRRRLSASPAFGSPASGYTTR